MKDIKRRNKQRWKKLIFFYKFHNFKFNLLNESNFNLNELNFNKKTILYFKKY